MSSNSHGAASGRMPPSSQTGGSGGVLRSTKGDLPPRPSGCQPDACDLSVQTSNPMTTPVSNHWLHSTTMNQIENLDVELQVSDLVQQHEPSLFGLRRKVAAALPQLNREGSATSKSVFSSRGRRSRNVAASEHLCHQFGQEALRAGSRVACGTDAPFHVVAGVLPEGQEHGKQVAKLESELQEREKDLEVDVLSRFEVSELSMDVYTEQRTGEWMHQGCGAMHDVPASTLPRIFSPWDIKIDTQAIIRRNKLRSFVELVGSTTVLRCPKCDIYADRSAGYRFEPEDCANCESTGLVKMVYVVCVTLRQSKFLPLQLPLQHLSGWYQDSLRDYFCTPQQSVHPFAANVRAMEAIRDSAYRVGMTHAKQHDARLLCVKANLRKRSCNSVVVLHRLSGAIRTFDIADSGTLQSGSLASSTDGSIRIRETPEVTRALASHRLAIRSAAGFRLDGVDHLIHLSERTTWNQFSITFESGPSPSSPLSSPAVTLQRSMLDLPISSQPHAGSKSPSSTAASLFDLGLSCDADAAWTRGHRSEFSDDCSGKSTKSSVRSFFSIGRISARKRKDGRLPQSPTLRAAASI